jgi:hypothetical protein
LNVFETIGIAYVILATALFTLELVYCSVKGIGTLRHLLDRGSGGPERRGSGSASADNSKQQKNVVKLSSSS